MHSGLAFTAAPLQAIVRPLTPLLRSPPVLPGARCGPCHGRKRSSMALASCSGSTPGPVAEVLYYAPAERVPFVLACLAALGAAFSLACGARPAGFALLLAAAVLEKVLPTHTPPSTHTHAHTYTRTRVCVCT